MEIRYASSPQDMKHYDTQRLREEYLIPEVFVENEITGVYSYVDRIITGAATPAGKELVLSAGEELKAEYFLERRITFFFKFLLLFGNIVYRIFKTNIFI